MEREPANLARMGPKRYRERIHKDSKFAEDHKNLPYKFSKPKKEKAQKIYVKCPNCSHYFFVTDEAILSICGSCKSMIKIKEYSKKGLEL